MRKYIPLLAALGLAVPAQAKHHEAAGSPPTAAATKVMQPSLAHARRDGDRARDRFRHPAETLEFFKIDPGMTVVDLSPGGGWYTRVLVPYLGENGTYIALNPDPSSNERMKDYLGGLREKFPAKAQDWNLEGAKVEAYNTNELTDERHGTVDRVLIFRWLHNLHRFGFLHSELNSMHALLAEGGMLGIVQHRAKPWAPAAYTDGNKGYLRQQDVIGLVEAHGFELVATSEINANACDSADHPSGVWEMPPSLRTKRDELKANGESDRMTLLFRKRP
jgi:predicted methyltransferase